MLGSVPPVAIDRRPRAVSLAHQEKSVAGASILRLRSPVQSEITFIASRARLDKIYAFLVRPTAIARDAVSFDALHRLSGVWVASSPSAAGRSILPVKQALNLFEQIEAHARRVLLHVGKCKERLNVFLGGQRKTFT